MRQSPPHRQIGRRSKREPGGGEKSWGRVPHFRMRGDMDVDLGGGPELERSLGDRQPFPPPP